MSIESVFPSFPWVAHKEVTGKQRENSVAVGLEIAALFHGRAFLQWCVRPACAHVHIWAPQAGTGPAMQAASHGEQSCTAAVICG